MPDRTYEDDVVRDRQKGRMSMDVTDTTYTGTLQIRPGEVVKKSDI